MRTLSPAFFATAIHGLLFAQPIIVTVAGTDLVFSGNGQPATSVSLGRVSKMTMDPQGRPVFTDPNHHLVFRLENDGSIRVIAGNNVQGLSAASQPGAVSQQSGGGFSGDGGPATAAALNRPQGVAYDAAGNLYIADTYNQCIRKVDTNGVISTIAGTRKTGFSGDGGQAVNATFDFPIDLATDSGGSVYVYDELNWRIRKITPQGTISTYAGTGTQASTPGAENTPAASTPIATVEGMAFDAQNNLYFSDLQFARIRKISGGIVSTVAGNGNAGYSGDGLALAVSLNAPTGVGFDSAGNLYFSDAGNQLVRKLANGSITTVAGSAPVAGMSQTGNSGDGGAALTAKLHDPWGVAVSPGGGTIYFADRDNFRVRRIAAQSTALQNTISAAAGDGKLIPSQNGIAAQLANFLDPFGVSFDSHGAMMIADTHNDILRRANADGSLATIAGTGAEESSGEGGAAAQAGLLGPFSASADSLGNLYEAEADGGLVRKISSSLTISTITCGSKPASFGLPTQAVADASGNLYVADFYNSGIVRRAASDGTCTLIQTRPSLVNPGGIALDQLGNLYVADFGGGRIFKISSSGIASVIAGGGNISGPSADGGAATNAQLGRPAGVTVDSAGNVYFTDVANATVRRIAVNGTISTIAGNGSQGFSGDGGPATAASLNGPWGLALDPTGGALYIADVLNNRIRKVMLVNPPSFSTSAGSVSLAANANGIITDPASVSVSSALGGLMFTVSADQPWVQVTPAGGAMPASLQITADPTSLAPGAYSSNITVSAAGASPPTRTILVNFTVNAAAPANLTADASSLAFSFTAGSSPTARQLTVRNAGSGAMDYSIASSLDNCSGWLSVSPAGGTVTPGSPGSVTVTADPTALSPGTCTGSLTISSAASGQTLQIPISASVAPSLAKLVISQTGVTFQAVESGGAPLPRTFGVLNAGQGSMTWNAAASVISAQAGWLSISQTSGTVNTPFTDIAQVGISVNPSGLAAGTYYGRVDVTAPPNATLHTVTVELNVLPAGTVLPPDVYPSSLIFSSNPGQNPSSQTISIANLAPQPVTYSSSRLTQSGSPWFVAVPGNGVATPNQPGTIVVQPDFTNLPAGVSQGSLVLAFPGGITQTVSITAIVSAGTAGPSAKGGERAASGCAPLLIHPTNAQQPFPAIMNQSVPIEVLVTDSCGKPVNNSNGTGKASVTFGNGDPGFALTNSQSNGTWSGTWLPRSGNVPATVRVTVSAFQTSSSLALLSGQIDLNATLASAASGPVLRAGGAVANAASLRANQLVAPGTIITIFGANLADGTAVLTGAPFPATLQNTQVSLGGSQLALEYVSDSQINAIVPFGIDVDTDLQLIVQRGTAISYGDSFTVAQAQPAIFTVDESGTGQGTILDETTGAIADSTAPATAGDILTIYCTGLGTVSPDVPAGGPGPNPGAAPTLPVLAAIGGLAAQVNAAVLQPGGAGVYLVTVTVPAGVTPGSQVPVTLSTAGQTSPAVTMAIQ